MTSQALPKQVEAGLPAIPIWRTALYSRGSAAHFLRRVVRKLTGRDWLFERWLRRRQVHVLSHADPLGRAAAIPVIGHIADLGVHFFSELYSPKTGDALKRHIHRHVNAVDTVLLSSAAVEDDFRKLYGATKGVRKVVHMVPAIDARDPLAERAVVERYALPDRFFYLPNKFWVHKNHRVVIEALGMLRARHRSVRIVSTGMTNDERQPHHFVTLMERARELGVEEDLQVLGIVPAADVTALMRNCVAVINPSKFEGWGLSVAEAREMGKAVILADIPVFREHGAVRVEYFPADDAGALADILIKHHDAFDRTTDDTFQDAAQDAHLAHQQKYAREYERVVLDTLAHHQGQR